MTSGSSGTDDATTTSGTTGLPELPCGCPGDKGYPGCTGSPIVCGHIFASCDGGDFATCAATADIQSDESLNCILEAIRDQAPGTYLYQLGSYESWTRRLHIEESGDHASVECHSIDLGSDCSDPLGGEVDPEGAASACLALEDIDEKGSCAWDLMQLSTRIAC